MRKLMQPVVASILCVLLFAYCQNQSSADKQNQSNNTSTPLGAGPGLIVVDDLNPGRGAAPIIVDTSILDTSKAVIWSKNGTVVGDININQAGNGFTISGQDGVTRTVNFSSSIDTLNLSNMELYYALPAVMNNDTVKVLVPRRYVLQSGGRQPEK